MSQEIIEKLDKIQRVQTEQLIAQARVEEKINGIVDNYERHEMDISQLKKNMAELMIKIAAISGGIALVITGGAQVIKAVGV